MPSCGLVLMKGFPSLNTSSFQVEHSPGGGESASSGISLGTKTGWGKFGIVKTVERSLSMPAG